MDPHNVPKTVCGPRPGLTSSRTSSDPVRSRPIRVLTSSGVPRPSPPSYKGTGAGGTERTEGFGGIRRGVSK